MIVAKFSTLAGGVFIEQDGSPEYHQNTRCFRFDDNGNAEWATYGDLTSNNPHPRWYSHQFTASQFILC